MTSCQPAQEVQVWSGTVEIEIELLGELQRRYRQTMFEHVRQVYGMKQRWKELAPLGVSPELLPNPLAYTKASTAPTAPTVYQAFIILFSIT